MTTSQKTVLVLLRLAMGGFFFYAGLSKILDPSWTAAGYLSSAKTLPDFYAWLSSGTLLPLINIVNEWGLLLLGVSLILGLMVRASSSLGMMLMFLYYLPVLDFPYVGHSFIIDEHIIYILVLALFFVWNRKIWSMDRWIAREFFGAELPETKKEVPKYRFKR